MSTWRPLWIETLSHCSVSRSTLPCSQSGRVPGRTSSPEVLLPNSFNAQAQDTAVSQPGMLTAPCDGKDSATKNSKKVKKKK